LNFKIDENLPAECAALLRGAGFGADTVAEEKAAELREAEPKTADNTFLREL